MGYWQYIFEHDEWYDLYVKNCSLKTQEEWHAESEPNIPIGLLYFISGLFFELTYIPFLIVMLRQEFFQHSCYKLMFLMGLFDLVILPCNGIITGIQVMRGDHYCNNPKFYYLVGTIGVWGFYGVMTICVILAIDRFLEICFSKIARHVFGGKRAYFWMIMPFLYQFYTGTQLCHIFSIKVYAMNHDPFYLVHGFENNPEFNFPRFQNFFFWNNSLIIALLSFFYIGLAVVSKIQTRMFHMPSVSKAQKLMTWQAIFVCGEMFFAPLLHILMLFWEFPVFLEIIAHWGWISLHGDTPIIYFIMNASLRKAVMEMILPFRKRVTSSWKRTRTQGVASNINLSSRIHPEKSKSSTIIP